MLCGNPTGLTSCSSSAAREIHARPLGHDSTVDLPVHGVSGAADVGVRCHFCRCCLVKWVRSE